MLRFTVDCLTYAYDFGSLYISLYDESVESNLSFKADLFIIEPLLNIYGFIAILMFYRASCLCSKLELIIPIFH